MEKDIVAIRPDQRPKDDTGLLLLARLLIVALAAGLVIGGLTAQIAFGVSGPYAGGAFFLGALIGMVCAVGVQMLNAVALHWIRRITPGLGPTGLRTALIPLPVLGAAAVAAALVGVGTWSASLAIVLVAALSGVTAWAGAPWCLTPLNPAARQG